MNQLIAKARELLKSNSKEYVLNKLISEKTTQQSLTSIQKAVEEALK